MVFPADKILSNETIKDVMKNPGVSSSKVTKLIPSNMPIGVRLILSLVFLITAIVYTISPIDLIPELLGPIGFVDDILVWVLTIAIDLNILIGRGVKKGKEISRNLKNKNGFFTEEI